MRLKVAAVSSNQNSFGLKQMLLFTEHGKAWRVLANSVGVRKVNDILTIPDDTDIATELTKKGFECPERSPDPSLQVMQEVWGSDWQPPVELDDQVAEKLAAEGFEYWNGERI